MGILRADRVSGLGGANAINGSVNFVSFNPNNTGDYLRVDRKDNSDFNLGTNDFTMEFWFNSRNVGSTLFPFAFAAPSVSASSDAGFYIRFNGGAVNALCFEGNNTIGSCTTGSVSMHTWYHVAYVRSGSTFTIYLDGTSAATASSAEAVNFDAGWNFNIGSAYTNTYHYNGYLSNLRIVNGTALYTSNFTVPNRLEVVENTVLLCCQSPGNVLQEASGKTLHHVHFNNNNKLAYATRFAPDVGEDHGTTFADNTKFDTLSYMVPPGGTTTERGRSRGVFGGGESPTSDNVMDYLNIQSGGRAVDFGDTSITTPTSPAVSSSTRGVFKLWKTPANLNTLEYITIATTSNSTDFGDLINGIEQQGTASNATRGLFAGGLYPGSQAHNPVEYITIATTGNGTDFGDLSGTVTGLDGTADTTRAVFAGGIGPGSPWPALNTIEYFTIATTGNATDFGDLNYSARNTGSTGDSTRGVWMGGTTPSLTNIIDYVTIQTTGNATDFGDLITASADIGATSNSIRGIMGAGVTPSRVNTIEQIIIQSIGNASDFGDLTRAVSQLGACSDSHGGIS